MDKKITLQLVGLDGNAFSLMGAFQSQARKEGWTKEEIETVLTEAKSGDYSHLVATLADHCEAPEDEEEVCYCECCGAVKEADGFDLCADCEEEAEREEEDEE